MPSLTVVILTYNEEHNIKRCIERAKLCTDKIVLIDSGSSDTTVSIAESLGAKVYTRMLEGDFAAQRNYALGKIDTEYIFYLDADEFVTESLAKAVKIALGNSNKDCAYSICRKNVAFGELVHNGVLAADCVPRIFPAKLVSWQGKVHERPVYELDTVVLDGYVLHETYKSWSQYWRKFDAYTEIWAQEAYERGKRTSKIGCFTHALGAFFKMFIAKKGFMDGFIGWVLCCNHFTYTLSKYTKLLELQRKGMKK